MQFRKQFSRRDALKRGASPTGGGEYTMYCHNLVHEDHDAMAQFEVGTDADEPVKADPACAQPAPTLVTPA